MVYIQSQKITEGEFRSLLEKTRIFCLEEIQDKRHKIIDGVSFENLVFSQMCVAAEGGKFEGAVDQTGKQTFPDIVAQKYYGVEVKVTAEDGWLSTGNSVAEGTRRQDVERIYMFFCKFGGKIDIKYRRYQECLYEVAVTHSPRYKINMDLEKGKSIFDKMSLDYDLLRKEKDPILIFKSYYRKLLKKEEALWWIDAELDIDRPTVRYLEKLDSNEKKSFVVESMVLFPQVFAKRANYEKAVAYLLSDYNSITSHIRDYFSSDGKKDVVIKGKDFKIPNKLWRLMNFAKNIEEVLKNIDESKLKFYWEVSIKKPYLRQWLGLLDEYGDTENEGLLASDIFKAGLNEKKN